MNDEIKELALAIDTFLEGKMSGPQLEQLTLSIIADDKFEGLSESTKDLIYQLDNKELNSLTDKELLGIKEQLLCS